MKFQVGDVVIKTTGGNKMTISKCFPGTGILSEHKILYQCHWFIDSSLFNDFFLENDIVTIEEYKQYLKIEERDDKLNKILNHF